MEWAEQPGRRTEVKVKVVADSARLRILSALLQIGSVIATKLLRKSQLERDMFDSVFIKRDGSAAKMTCTT